MPIRPIIVTGVIAFSSITAVLEGRHPEFVEKGLTAADFAWSPDGSRIAAYLITDVRKGGKIVMIDMGRNPPPVR
jgi:hypothetical protein